MRDFALLKNKLAIFIALIMLLANSCNKHKGFKKVKDAEVVESALLDCLGRDHEGEYVIRALDDLKDSIVFYNSIDSNLVPICWGKHSPPNVDLASRTLMGVSFTYIIDGTLKNGSAGVKIYKSESGQQYIIDVFVDSSDQGGFSVAYGQMWFTVPKIADDATVEYNLIRT